MQPGGEFRFFYAFHVVLADMNISQIQDDKTTISKFGHICVFSAGFILCEPSCFLSCQLPPPPSIV